MISAYIMIKEISRWPFRFRTNVIDIIFCSDEGDFRATLQFIPSTGNGFTVRHFRPD
jgi:hypothetical protein